MVCLLSAYDPRTETNIENPTNPIPLINNTLNMILWFLADVSFICQPIITFDSPFLRLPGRV